MKWNKDDGEIGEMQKLDGVFNTNIHGKGFYIPLTWLFKLLFKWIRK